MGTIAAELQTFYNTVGSSLDGMKAQASTIVDTVSIVASQTQTASSGISSYYQSANKDTVLKRFVKLSKVLSDIGTSVSGDLLGGMLSGAQTVVDLVRELTEINTKIAEQQRLINTTRVNEEGAKTTIQNAQSQISSLNSDFTTKHNEALQALSKVKGMDSSLPFVESYSISSYLDVLDQLEYGTFESAKFTASNGLTVEYWIYVPDYGVEVSDMAAMLYMHGGSTHQNVSLDHAKQYGLTSHIATGKVTPPCIVVMPAMTDFTERGLTAVKELMDSVVEEYNVDPNKVAVSGHSYGGISACKLVNMYPDYWSCCIPISGSASITESFNGMKMWAFGGTAEGGSGSTSFGAVKNAAALVNRVGGQGYFTPLSTGHSGTNKITYEQEYESPDGINENPIYWAARQERA